MLITTRNDCIRVGCIILADTAAFSEFSAPTRCEDDDEGGGRAGGSEKSETAAVLAKMNTAGTFYVLFHQFDKMLPKIAQNA